MPDSRYGSLQVCLLRVAALEANGGPAVGADNGYVSEATISFDLGIELGDDVDLEKQNGCGDICQSYFKQGAIKRATGDAALCELDIQVAAMITGGDLILASTTPIGFELPKINDDAPNGVCLELWTRAWDGAGQATPAVAPISGDNAWWHWVLPRYKGQLDTLTMENDFMDFALTGFSVENENIPAAGPFGDWPTPVIARGGISAAAGWFLDSNFPTETGYVAVTDGAS